MNGCVKQSGNWKDALTKFGVEASWRLAQWTSLDNFLDSASEDCQKKFEVQIGHCLKSYHESAYDLLLGTVSESRCQLLGSLAAASMDSYRRTYDVALRLHALEDVQFLSELRQSLKEIIVPEIATRMIHDGNQRLRQRMDVLPPDLKVRDVVASVQRTMFADLLDCEHPLHGNPEIQVTLKQICGKYWLDISKMARMAHFQTSAHHAILKAEEYAPSGLIIAKAKYLRLNGDITKAVDELDGALKSGPALEDSVKAKAMVCLGKWHMEADTSDSKTIENLFKSAVNILPK